MRIHSGHGTANKGSIDEAHTECMDMVESGVPSIQDGCSLSHVVPVRTATRKLSMTGRKATLNRFQLRRAVQCHAFINPIYGGRKQDEVEAVYKEISFKKEFERPQIDHSRMIWKGQAQWLAAESEQVPVPGSTEEASQNTRRVEGIHPINHKSNEADPLTDPEPWDVTRPYSSIETAWSSGECQRMERR